MGATTPDEGMMALTQHPPRHSEHLLAWGLWVLQRDDKGRGRTGTMTTTTTRTRKPRDHHYEPLLIGWIKGAR